MEQLKKKVRIVPMTNEYLNDVAELERTCFSNLSLIHISEPTRP